MTHPGNPPRYGQGGRECPRCGTPFEDDGDRRIDDECFQCGWATPYRRERNRQNARLFAEIRAKHGPSDPTLIVES